MPIIVRPAVLLLALVLPLFGGCIAAVATGAITVASSVNDRRGFGTVANDKYIQLSAYDSINRDKEIALKNNVAISVYNGVMLLIGEVRTPELRTRAEALVSGFAGVRRVVNEIEVREPEGFWSRRADTGISARVKTGLVDISGISGFDPTRIKVSTTHRVVYLLGIVTAEEEAAVVEVARTVPAVERVVKIFEPLPESLSD